MTIHVTEEHIKAGRYRSPEDCPVALAVREATGKPWTIGVISAVEPLGVGVGRDKLHRLPEPVSEWILKFDNRQHVAPFFFELELEPNESITQT